MDEELEALGGRALLKKKKEKAKEKEKTGGKITKRIGQVQVPVTGGREGDLVPGNRYSLSRVLGQVPVTTRVPVPYREGRGQGSTR